MCFIVNLQSFSVSDCKCRNIETAKKCVLEKQKKKKKKKKKKVLSRGGKVWVGRQLQTNKILF